MQINVTRDTCPICGEVDNIQKGIILGRHCYCRACLTTWNFETGEVWGYDKDGKRTPAQKRIDDRVQHRRDSGKKWDGAI